MNEEWPVFEDFDPILIQNYPSLLPVRHSDKAACPHLYTDSIHVAKHWHYGTAV